jgi:hypothetical protein
VKRILLLAALGACASDSSSTKDSTSSSKKVAATPDPKAPPADPPPPSEPSGTDTLPGAEPEPPPPPPEPAVEALPAVDGHDFLATVKPLVCGDEPPARDPEIFEAHCEKVEELRTTYAKAWIDTARPFFAEKVPDDVPQTVVYPFAGGDLSTALTVYPDAREITTLSLEPAGDPRTLDTLKPKELKKALGKVEKEFRHLYKVNFSNTIDILEAMDTGKLPTQLIFSLSALQLHGFEPTAVYYFEIEKDGSLDYMNEDDVAKLKPPGKGKVHMQNRAFGNVEIRYRKIGEKQEHVYRHIRWNLDDDHLKKDGRVLEHLKAKGQVAAMTKAASYLLTWDSFRKIRGYLLDHMVWMVSDATGVLPEHLDKAGFEYETYGTYAGSHMKEAGSDATRQWGKEFKAQAQRDLAFRFGYPDKNRKPHLIITRKKG